MICDVSDTVARRLGAVGGDLSPWTGYRPAPMQEQRLVARRSLDSSWAARSNGGQSVRIAATHLNTRFKLCAALVAASLFAALINQVNKGDRPGCRLHLTAYRCLLWSSGCKGNTCSSTAFPTISSALAKTCQ